MRRFALVCALITIARREQITAIPKAPARLPISISLRLTCCATGGTSKGPHSCTCDVESPDVIFRFKFRQIRQQINIGVLRHSASNAMCSEISQPLFKVRKSKPPTPRTNSQLFIGRASRDRRPNPRRIPKSRNHRTRNMRIVCRDFNSTLVTSEYEIATWVRNRSDAIVHLFSLVAFYLYIATSRS